MSSGLPRKKTGLAKPVDIAGAFIEDKVQDNAAMASQGMDDLDDLDLDAIEAQVAQLTQAEAPELGVPEEDAAEDAQDAADAEECPAPEDAQDAEDADPTADQAAEDAQDPAATGEDAPAEDQPEDATQAPEAAQLDEQLAADDPVAEEVAEEPQPEGAAEEDVADGNLGADDGNGAGDVEPAPEPAPEVPPAKAPAKAPAVPAVPKRRGINILAPKDTNAAPAAPPAAAKPSKPALGAKPAVASKPGLVVKPQQPAAATLPAPAKTTTAAAPVRKGLAMPKAKDAAAADGGKPSGGAAPATKPAVPAAKPSVAAKQVLGVKPAAAKPAGVVVPVAKKVVAPAAGSTPPAAAPVVKKKVIQARVTEEPDAGGEDGENDENANPNTTQPAAAKPLKKPLALKPTITAPAAAVAKKTGGAAPATGAKAAKPAAATGGDGKKAGKGAKDPDKPYIRSAYMFFAEEMRPRIKEEDPSISASEVMKKLGELWNALSEDEKTPFKEMSEEERERLKDKVAEYKAAQRKEKAAKEAAEKASDNTSKVPRPKNAFMMFCDDRRPEIKAENPEAKLGDISKLLSDAWRDTDPEDKAHYEAMAKEARAAALAAKEAELEAMEQDDELPKKPAPGKTKAGLLAKPTKAKPAAPRHVDPEDAYVEDGADDLEDDEVAAIVTMELDPDAAPPPPRPKKAATKRINPGTSSHKDSAPGTTTTSSRSTRSRPAKGKKGKKRQAKAEVADEEDEEQAQGGAESDSSDSDRENMDWEEHPAEMIVGETTDGKYIVKVAGLDFTDYAKVDIRAAKRQRTEVADAEEEQPAPCPVSLDLVTEWESFQRSFWATVRDRTDKDVLDLEDLPPNSSLEMCYLLGKMREPSGALDPKVTKKRGREDVFIRVPALHLSMLHQRTIDYYKTQLQAAQLRVQELETAMAGGEAEEMAEEEQ